MAALIQDNNRARERADLSQISAVYHCVVLSDANVLDLKVIGFSENGWLHSGWHMVDQCSQYSWSLLACTVAIWRQSASLTSNKSDYRRHSSRVFPHNKFNPGHADEWSESRRVGRLSTKR